MPCVYFYVAILVCTWKTGGKHLKLQIGRMRARLSTYKIQHNLKARDSVNANNKGYLQNSVSEHCKKWWQGYQSFSKNNNNNNKNQVMMNIRKQQWGRVKTKIIEKLSKIFLNKHQVYGYYMRGANLGGKNQRGVVAPFPNAGSDLYKIINKQKEPIKWRTSMGIV